MDRRLQLKFLKPGLHTTIQDHGREHFRAFGVPKAGPMDVASAKLANWLVGNPESAPLMEITMVGPVIQIQGQGQIAFTGAPFKLNLNHYPLSMNQSIELSGQHELTIEKALKGCRCYMAVAGNWGLSSWLDSCSASPQSGRDLTPDSIIEKGTTLLIHNPEPVASRSVSRPWKEVSIAATIRVLAGPEYSMFNTAAIKEFLGRKFTISPQSNRMGYRLDSPLANYSSPVEVISSGVVPGTIQVTHSGQLIILLADAQTTGGYPRIANVISVDQDKLAQMRPGDSFSFRVISLKEAYEVF